MVALAGTTGRALAVPTSASEGFTGRLGGPWRAQPWWRGSPVAPQRHRRQQRGSRRQQARAALLDPPPFDPAKLRVEYLPGGRETRLDAGRRYTLTHNDVTGSLQLSIGREYNRRQLDGWYTRILRDEILAEWQDTAPPVAAAAAACPSPPPPRPSLHIYCHVSGEELWPAPPQLRSFIFQREMALVLDTIWHAEGAPGGLLAAAPHLVSAPVYVHLRSDIPALDRVVEWGVLGERSTWRTAQSSIMRSLLSSVMGTMDEADATDGSNGSWSRSSFSSASGSWDEAAACAAAEEVASGSTSAGSGSLDDAGDGGSGGAGGGEEQHGQEERPPAAWQQQPQQQQLQQQAGNGAGAGVLAPPPASAGSSSLVNGSTGSPARVPGAAISSGGGGSGGGAGLGAANSAVSLAAAQQAAERVTSSWLAMPAAAGDGSQQRLPAVEVVASSRQR